MPIPQEFCNTKLYLIYMQSAVVHPNLQQIKTEIGLQYFRWIHRRYLDDACLFPNR